MRQEIWRGQRWAPQLTCRAVANSLRAADSPVREDQEGRWSKGGQLTNPSAVFVRDRPLEGF
jgi:hypothetical protein